MTPLLPRFNIAAIPIDSSYHEDCFRAAVSLSAIVDGYQLHPDKALPHTTLCQFRAEDKAQALQFVLPHLGKELDLSIADIVTQAGADEHEGKWWVWYPVELTPPLVKLHEEIIESLKTAAAQIQGKIGKNYFPHFTLARARLKPENSVLAAPSIKKLANRRIACRVRLGLSDENGQLLKILDGPA